LYNGLEPNQNDNGKKKRYESNELAPDKWTVISAYSVDKDGKKVRRYVKKQCFHCLEPACASACFVGALQKSPEGAVVYNEKICVGCRYCMIACPFGILKFEWDKPFPRVLKCQMCLARVSDNQMPACAIVCPTKVLTFGEREKIVEEAKKRQASNPGLYISQIYGMKEVGGTSWLYLSDVPFSKLGFRTDLTEKPIPEYTWQVLKWTPHIFIGWGALLTGMYLYTKRRAAVEAEEEMYAPVGTGDEK
jgi:formate dehydrogenase iron-sulfur subunit